MTDSLRTNLQREVEHFRAIKDQPIDEVINNIFHYLNEIFDRELESVNRSIEDFEAYALNHPSVKGQIPPLKGQKEILEKLKKQINEE